uniref:Peptidase M20 dimerisation domain-containing protein n=1 Tax=Ditylum brightwellii TaxID=49249 RepID=A0A7S4QW46_9STRA
MNPSPSSSPTTTPYPSNEEILSQIKSNQSNQTSFLSQMVSIDSTLEKGEEEVMDFIWNFLKTSFSSQEFEMEKVPMNESILRNLPGFSPIHWKYGNQYNIVLRNKQQQQQLSESNKSLILCGHADVVPSTTTTTSSSWTKCTTPFTPTIHLNRLYGRGSGDMKAGLSCMIYALLTLQQLHYIPSGTLQLEIVCEEECTGNGCLALRHHAAASSSSSLGEKKKFDAVIIPEPFPFIVTAQLGVLWFQLHIVGKPAHVLDTSLGINAIEVAFDMYRHLQSTLQVEYNTNINSREEEEENQAFKDIKQPICFNVGKIKGGDWASSVPSFCDMDVRVGFFPSQSVECVKHDVEECLRKFVLESSNDTMKHVKYDITYFGFQADGAVLLEEFCNNNNDDDNDVDDEVSKEEEEGKGGWQEG